MPNEQPPQIFLSYAWANSDIADEIDNDFKSVGITFQRDVRDVKYTGSIKEFMHRIGKSDFVVMLISDEYMRSENCLYEVTELLNAHEFEKRILPVILNNAPVYKRDDHKTYYMHWQNELKKVNDLLIEFTNENTLEAKKKIQSVNDCLGIFFQKITDLKSEKFEKLKIQNYKSILDKIGFKGDVMEKILEINKIANQEEQELAIEKLLKNHSNNQYVLFQRAYLEAGNKLYKKSKQHFVELIQEHPLYDLAYSNLGVILMDFFSEFNLAKKYLEKAIEISPNNAFYHYNLGVLFDNYFGKPHDALKQYQIAIMLDPNISQAHYNIAIVLTSHFNEYIIARTHYEKAIALDPKNSNIHYNLAILLKEHFGEYIEARLHYEKAIQINTNDFESYNNLGNLLKDSFSEYENAKLNYELAIKANPNYTNSYNNLAVLLEEHFSDYEGARINYEKALKIDPNYERAKNNLANLIRKHFS